VEITWVVTPGVGIPTGKTRLIPSLSRGRTKGDTMNLGEREEGP